MYYELIALAAGFVLLVSGVFVYAGAGPAFIIAGGIIICLAVLYSMANH